MKQTPTGADMPIYTAVDTAQDVYFFQNSRVLSQGGGVDVK